MGVLDSLSYSRSNIRTDLITKVDNKYEGIINLTITNLHEYYENAK